MEELFDRNFLGGFFWQDFLGRNSLGGFFWEVFFGRNSYIVKVVSQLSYLNMEGIDLFVKILVFVKILSESTRKEGRISILRSARGKLIALKNGQKRGL